MLRTTFRPLAHGLRSALGTHGLAARLAAIEASLKAGAATPAAGAGDGGQQGGVAVPGPGPDNAPGPAPLDVNLLLHQSRGAMLRALPRGVRRMLSAGCAGGWYFDWIEQTCGPVERHLGIEFYMPRPERLPDNVVWIQNTVSDMGGVPDQSCDLLFSGQNIEHLWPEEVAGFLLEAARVLAPGGRLVVDSPNRRLTAALNWSHPEHTIELTPEEGASLLRLSGFDVTVSKGIWLCRDPHTGRYLPFDPNDADPDWSTTERLIAAHDRPEESFIWWMEGVRAPRQPDRAAVTALAASLFREHWPERMNRLIVPASRPRLSDADGEWITAEAGAGGIVFFGPYMPLRAGRYRCVWRFRSAPEEARPLGLCDVMAEGRDKPLAHCEIRPGEAAVALDFELPATTFGLQFRCLSLGEGAFQALRRIEVTGLH